jgi:hypothetical protein
MAVKLKTWVWVVVGIAAVCILLVIAMAGAGIYFFTQNIQTTKASPAVASQEFEAVRARFKGQAPLIELDAKGNLLRSNADREAPQGTPRPETLHVMAFDPDDGGLVKVTIPFWLLRMQMNHAAVNFGNHNMTLEDLKLTVEDLDRLGPSLVLDQLNEGGDRVLVWSQ